MRRGAAFGAHVVGPTSAHTGTDSLHHCQSIAMHRNISFLVLPFAAFCCTAWATLAARR